MDELKISIPLTHLWKRLVDKIVIISLKECNERREKIEKELERVGIKEYSFSIVKKDKEDTKRGCFLSHQNIIKDSLNMGLERILILEDDAYFIESLDKLSSSLEVVLEWIEDNKFKDNFLDIFFLGHLPILPLKPINKQYNIVKSDGSRYAHCYIITRDGMVKIGKLEYDGKHYDYYTGQLENNYSIYPMISYQDDVVSVNDFNKFYKIFSGVRNKISCRRLCRFAEMVCFFKGSRLIGDIIDKITFWKKKDKKPEYCEEYMDI